MNKLEPDPRAIADFDAEIRRLQLVSNTGNTAADEKSRKYFDLCLEESIAKKERFLQWWKESVARGDYSEPVGNFEVTSGELLVADPCYVPDAMYVTRIQDALPGLWSAGVVRYFEGDWGVRVAELHAYHVDYLEGDKVRWVTEESMGVDSGQGGIFDLSKYGYDPKYEEWYNICCAHTLSSKGAGIVEQGVVSRSGFGDGFYGVHTRRIGKKVVGVRIEYIGPIKTRSSTKNTAIVRGALREYLKTNPTRTEFYVPKEFSLQEQIDMTANRWPTLYKIGTEAGRHYLIENLFFSSNRDWSKSGGLADPMYDLEDNVEETAFAREKEKAREEWFASRGGPEIVDKFPRAEPFYCHAYSEESFWEKFPNNIRDDYLLGLMEHLDYVLSFGFKPFFYYFGRDTTMEKFVESVVAARRRHEALRTRLLKTFQSRLKKLGYHCKPTMKYDGDVYAETRCKEYLDQKPVPTKDMEAQVKIANEVVDELIGEVG